MIVAISSIVGVDRAAPRITTVDPGGFIPIVQGDAAIDG